MNSFGINPYLEYVWENQFLEEIVIVTIKVSLKNKKDKQNWVRHLQSTTLKQNVTYMLIRKLFGVE
jgi:hypothetical protein